MDIDRFLSTHQPTWARLGDLTARAGRGTGRLSAAELDELVRLYQRVSTHLSYARTYLRDPALVATLSRLVARSGAVVYGTRPRTLRGVGRFFSTTFPAAVWHIRRFVAVSMLLLILPGAAVAVWLANSPAALDAAAPAAVREAYVGEEFEDYYSSGPASSFASQVFTNNVRVGLMAFAFGVLFAVPTVFVLAFNGANVGVAAGLFAAAGQTDRFFGLILPHGLLELTAVCIAGAAGLKLGWSLVDPGDRTRADALAEEGRRSVIVVLGLILAFAVAGAIEGFITGSGFSTAGRVGVGLVAEAAFVTWIVVQGREAARHGITGALGESDPAGWTSTPSGSRRTGDTPTPKVAAAVSPVRS